MSEEKSTVTSLKERANAGVKTNFKKQSNKFVIVNNMLHYKYCRIMKVVSDPDNLCVIKNQTIRDQYFVLLQDFGGLI